MGVFAPQILPMRVFSCLPPILSLLAIAPLAADTVTVANGDQLNGRIEKLDDGKLFLKTDYAGTIRIDWEEVVAVDSDALYQVELDTGRRYTAAVERGEEEVRLVEGNSTLPLASVQVVAIDRLKDNGKPPGFWDVLEGSAGAGYSFNRGNSRQTQASLSAEGAYRAANYQAKADLTSIFSRTDDARPTNRHALDLRYDRFLGAHAFAFALAGFERNDRKSLDLRSRFGGGFGWKVMDSKKNEFDVLGGVTSTNERFRRNEGEMVPRRATGEGLVGFEWKATRFGGVRLSTRMTAHPNFVQTGRYRIEYDSSARIPLVAGLTWRLSLFDRFDSAPPREDVQRNDYGMVSTFGLSF